MILNEGKSKDSFTGLNFIRNSTYEFVLTGSRYFNLETKNSDWDFMIQYNKDTYKQLKKDIAMAGFYPTDSYTDYGINDPGIINLFRFDSENSSSNQVDVQVVFNIKDRMEINSLLLDSNYMTVLKENNLSKKDMIYLYQFIYLLKGENYITATSKVNWKELS
jgi:hypothetical protein